MSQVKALMTICDALDTRSTLLHGLDACGCDLLGMYGRDDQRARKQYPRIESAAGTHLATKPRSKNERAAESRDSPLFIID